MLELHIGPKPAPSPDIPWEAIIAVLPHVLWGALLLFILFLIGREGIAKFAGSVKKIGVSGFEIEFERTLQSAAEAQGKILTAIDLGRASRRLAREKALLGGARLLWIDDRPDNNRNEIELLESAGARVDVQTSSDGAETALGYFKYDLVVSDIVRGNDRSAGLNFAVALARNVRSPPLIFYVSQAQRPVPQGAFGITDRPDELVHLILDALARRRS